MKKIDRRNALKNQSRGENVSTLNENRRSGGIKRDDKKHQHRTLGEGSSLPMVSAGSSIKKPLRGGGLG